MMGFLNFVKLILSTGVGVFMQKFSNWQEVGSYKVKNDNKNVPA